MADDNEIVTLLRELRDGQRDALARMTAQLELAQQQAERMNKVAEDSVRLQRAAIERAKRLSAAILPVGALLAALVVYLIVKYRIL